MPAVLNLKCPSCGQNHAFCLPNADIFNDKETYEFRCPTTMKVAHLSVPHLAWGDAKPCPPLSVVVRVIR